MLLCEKLVANTVNGWQQYVRSTLGSLSSLVRTYLIINLHFLLVYCCLRWPFHFIVSFFWWFLSVFFRTCQNASSNTKKSSLFYKKKKQNRNQRMICSHYFLGVNFMLTLIDWPKDSKVNNNDKYRTNTEKNMRNKTLFSRYFGIVFMDNSDWHFSIFVFFFSSYSFFTAPFTLFRFRRNDDAN